MATEPTLTHCDHDVPDADRATPPDSTATSLRRTGRPKPIQPPGVSLTRLHLLRAGYLLIGVGLVLVKWPLLVNHSQPWPLFEGVVTCMLVAMSLLAFLGLRYPLQLLPILLFELGWKFIWVGVVAAPLWAGHRLDPATLSVFYSCLVVVFVLAVVPWRYVFAQYVSEPGDRWRSDRTRAVRDDA
jgi:hypothetical protein